MNGKGIDATRLNARIMNEHIRSKKRILTEMNDLLCKYCGEIFGKTDFEVHDDYTDNCCWDCYVRIMAEREYNTQDCKLCGLPTFYSKMDNLCDDCIAYVRGEKD